MRRSVRAIGWGATFLVLIVFAIPWFMWGSATVVAGLPLWLWWHVGWMVIATVVFYAFTRRAWDDLMGVEAGEKRADVRTDGGGSDAHTASRPDERETDERETDGVADR